MRVIAFRKLREFAERGHAAEAEKLRSWYRQAENADWTTFADVKATFPSADLVGRDKLVFNIGNGVRVICLIHFGRPTLYLLWVGTHSEYDRIEVSEL